MSAYSYDVYICNCLNHGVVVPRAWIGKEAIVRLKVKEKGGKRQW
jgi:hypothetical protein